MDFISFTSLSLSDEKRWEIYYSITMGASIDYLANKFRCKKSDIQTIHQTTINNPICKAIIMGISNAKLNIKNKKGVLVLSPVALIENKDIGKCKFISYDKPPLNMHRWDTEQKKKKKNQEINQF